MLVHETLETQADEVIRGYEPEYVVSIVVDWNRNSLFDHGLSYMQEFTLDVSTDRSLGGSVPEEVLLIEGTASAEMTFTVSGEYQGMSLVSVFSPFNPDSPFFGKNIMGAEVFYQMGVVTDDGVAYYPQFVGTIRTISPDRESDTVTITALDRMEVLRRPVHFPPWAVSQYWSNRGRTRAQLCDTQWVVDHCLRLCDTSPTAYRPTTRDEVDAEDGDKDGVQFWLNCTGSHLPTVGWVDNLNAQTYPATESSGIEMFSTLGAARLDSPNPEIAPLCFTALGDSGSDFNKYWVANRDEIGANGTQFYGFTLNTRDSYYQTAAEHEVLNVRLGDLRVISLRIANGQLWAHRLYEPDGSVMESVKLNIPTDQDWVRVHAIWDNTPQTGTRVYLECGDQSTGGWQVVGPAWNGLLFQDDFKGLITVTHRVSLNDVYFATRYVFGAGTDRLDAYRDARYKAVLDLGRNRFSFMPTRNADDAAVIISDVVGAEFGAAHWDEYGVFRFWNYEHLLELQNNVVRDYTLDDVEGLSLTNTLDSVRNIYSVETGRKLGVGQVAYASSDADEFYCPPGVTTVFKIWSDSVLCTYPRTMDRFSSDGVTYPEWNDNVFNGYVITFEKTPDVWTEDPAIPGVFAFHYFDNHGFIQLNIFNSHPWPIRLSDTNGSPRCNIGGTHIQPYDSTVTTRKDLDSISDYRGRNLKLSGDWYQDQFQSNGMLDVMMPRTVNPSPATDAIRVAGDPRVQLGDCVSVSDPDGMGSMVLQEYGIIRKLTVGGGLTDTYTVEVIAPPGVGIWDSETAGLWDSTFIWSA